MEIGKREECCAPPGAESRDDDAVTCVVCGDRFRRRRRTSVVCSDRCRTRLLYWRQRGPVRLRVRIVLLREQIAELERVMVYLRAPAI